MATGNSINANSSGLQSYNGAGVWAGRTIVAGNAGITVTNGDGIAGNPSISSTGGGFTWTEVTGTTQALAVDNGYIANNAGVVTLTLPSSSVSIGASIFILGKGAGGWLVAQNANQVIHVGSSTSTTGVGGSIASTNQWDTVELICITAGTSSIWQARVSGNITVV